MNIIKVKLNKRIGDLKIGQVVQAELKKHGVVTRDNEGMNRVLRSNEYSVIDVPKPLKISLLKARELSGRYVKDITKESGRSRTSLFSYENGTRQVPDDVKKKYASALGMKQEWIEWDMDKNREHYNKTNPKKVEKESSPLASPVTAPLTTPMSKKVTKKSIKEVFTEETDRYKVLEIEIAKLGDNVLERLRSIENDLEDTREVINGHVDIYNENADIYNKNVDYFNEKTEKHNNSIFELEDNNKKMNERIKKLEEYIIDIETELTEMKEVYEKHNQLPWYKKPFTKIKIDQGE